MAVANRTYSPAGRVRQAVTVLLVLAIAVAALLGAAGSRRAWAKDGNGAAAPGRRQVVYTETVTGALAQEGDDVGVIHVDAASTLPVLHPFSDDGSGARIGVP